MSFGIHRLPSAALILAAGLALPAVAQAPGGFVSAEDKSRDLQAIQQRAAHDTAQEAAKTEAAKRQREFTARVVDFTNSWNKLIQVAGRGGWNTKEARKTREAFERLVHCQAWIEDPNASSAKEIAASPK
ncbi:MAG TPA: hypothetical protein VN893_04005 [Bryobacteraceae bacterium]|nr:hypothetical protein [Bryobacteraceae bacterium]